MLFKQSHTSLCAQSLTGAGKHDLVRNHIALEHGAEGLLSFCPLARLRLAACGKKHSPSDDVGVHARRGHLREEILDPPRVSGRGERPRDGVVRYDVRGETRRGHLPQPMQGAWPIVLRCACLDHGIERNRVWRQAGTNHAQQPARGPVCIALPRATVDGHVETSLIWGNRRRCLHPVHPLAHDVRGARAGRGLDHGRVRQPVGPQDCNLHTFEDPQRRGHVAGFRTSVQHRVVRHDVRSRGLLFPLVHSELLQPTQCQHPMSTLGAGIDHAGEGDVVGRHAAAPHLLQPSRASVHVASPAEAAQHRVVRGPIRSQLCLKHPVQPTFCLVTAPRECTAVDHRVERNFVRRQTGRLHTGQPCPRRGRIASLRACVDHDVVRDGGQREVRPVLKRAQPKFCFGNMAGLRSGLDKFAKCLRIQPYALGEHALVPSLRANKVPGVCISFQHGIEEHSLLAFRHLPHNLVECNQGAFDIANLCTAVHQGSS
mmetsp:Transcript_52580/g.169674  ORF Transcript_52580/g.169674 Transcript_52580/m.169674 type:complete len:486 (+) Transcript_52580:71-1528(+)